MEIKRVFDILENLKKNSTKTDILNYKINKKWFNYSVDDFINNTNYVSSALLKLGLNSGDKIAIMANNMPQWNFADYGAQQVNMPSTPIFPTISKDDLKYILNHSEAKIIFISEKATYLKLIALEKELLHLKYIYSFNLIDGAKLFSDFIELGKSTLDLDKINNLKNKIIEDDLMTILYTSGTTGKPKGVMISHKNIISNVKIIKDIAPFSSEWRALSFLPINHVYERMVNTLYLFHGVSIYYAESFETIGDNCREIKPNIFVAVPRILERLLEKICSVGDKLTGFKKLIFNWSLKIAERFEFHEKNGKWYTIQRKIADVLVYKKWRMALGGNIVAVVSGGSALNPRIERIFYCAGLNLLQGYGLTETCVVVSANRMEESNRMFGSVGLVVENTQVKIAEQDGEILMKGPSLMMGYYKDSQATSEAIDHEGWFHTGDIGIFIENRFLKITDRKKELFKTSSGKYISPMALENKLKESKYIDQCIILGENQKFVSALIIPSINNLKDYFTLNKIEPLDEKTIHQNENVIKLITEHVLKTNESLAAFEQIKRHQLINTVWSVESGEITPKLSLKRKFIIEKNQEIINTIFRL